MREDSAEAGTIGIEVIAAETRERRCFFHARFANP